MLPPNLFCAIAFRRNEYFFEVLVHGKGMGIIMNPFVLITIFVVSTLVGYKLIKNVPSLLHTPLMSGMNALSGITVLGALSATGAAVYSGNRILGFIAIFLAMLNVSGGFGVTHRMLRMFKHKEVNKK